MKRNALKIFKVLCGIVVVLALNVAGITAMSVYAADNGIYIATATPHYRNPQTGAIEDSGGDGSEVLGQSMTESATYKKALVEVDKAGNTYITIRLKLMDNIRNPQFQVDGVSVSAELMQEDYTNNTADYRMKVNSENSVIRCSMNVIAMGRDVIFYITVSDLTGGSGDFITSITVDKQSSVSESSKSPAATEAVNSKAEEVKAADTQEADRVAEAQADKVTEDTLTNDKTTGTMKPEEAGERADSDDKAADIETLMTEAQKQDSNNSENTTDSTSKQLNTENTAKTSGVAGLNEYDESGNKVTTASEDTVKSKVTSKAPVIIAVVVVVLAAGGAAGYFVYKKRK